MKGKKQEGRPAIILVFLVGYTKRGSGWKVDEDHIHILQGQGRNTEQIKITITIAAGSQSQFSSNTSFLWRELSGYLFYLILIL